MRSSVSKKKKRLRAGDVAVARCSPSTQAELEPQCCRWKRKLLKWKQKSCSQWSRWQLVALERLRQEALEIKDFDSDIHVLEGTQLHAFNPCCKCLLLLYVLASKLIGLSVKGLSLAYHIYLSGKLPWVFSSPSLYISAHPSRQSICMKEKLTGRS